MKPADFGLVSVSHYGLFFKKKVWFGLRTCWRNTLSVLPGSDVVSLPAVRHPCVWAANRRRRNIRTLVSVSSGQTRRHSSTATNKDTTPHTRLWIEGMLCFCKLKWTFEVLWSWVNIALVFCSLVYLFVQTLILSLCCPGDSAVVRCGGVPGQPVHLLDHRKHLGCHVSWNYWMTWVFFLLG